MKVSLVVFRTTPHQPHNGIFWTNRGCEEGTFGGCVVPLPWHYKCQKIDPVKRNYFELREGCGEGVARFPGTLCTILTHLGNDLKGRTFRFYVIFCLFSGACGFDARNLVCLFEDI